MQVVCYTHRHVCTVLHSGNNYTLIHIIILLPFAHIISRVKLVRKLASIILLVSKISLQRRDIMISSGASGFSVI